MRQVNADFKCLKTFSLPRRLDVWYKNTMTNGQQQWCNCQDHSGSTYGQAFATTCWTFIRCKECRRHSIRTTCKAGGHVQAYMRISLLKRSYNTLSEARVYRGRFWRQTINVREMKRWLCV